MFCWFPAKEFKSRTFKPIQIASNPRQGDFALFIGVFHQKKRQSAFLNQDLILPKIEK
jgi:hypothetical protein